MRNLLFSIALLLVSAVAFGQVSGPIFCGKRWYSEMLKDADGTIHPPEKGAEKDYMHFTCDSAFTLAEAGVVLKGKWTFDEDAMLITLQQQQIATMPEFIAFHIIDYDDSHLVLIGQKGTDSEQTLFLYTK